MPRTDRGLGCGGDAVQREAGLTFPIGVILRLSYVPLFLLLGVARIIPGLNGIWTSPGGTLTISMLQETPVRGFFRKQFPL